MADKNGVFGAKEKAPRRGAFGGGSDGDQLVGIFAQADLLGMLNLSAPCGMGEVDGQVVQVGAVSLAGLGIGDSGLGVGSLGTGQIQSNGIEGSEHTDIGDDGDVVLSVAVAVGADIADQADVEVGTAVHNCLGVLGNLVVQVQSGIVVVGFDGLHGAHIQAAAAAVALDPWLLREPN